MRIWCSLWEETTSKMQLLADIVSSCGSRSSTKVWKAREVLAFHCFFIFFPSVGSYIVMVLIFQFWICSTKITRHLWPISVFDKSLLCAVVVSCTVMVKTIIQLVYLCMSGSAGAVSQIFRQSWFFWYFELKKLQWNSIKPNSVFLIFEHWSFFHLKSYRNCILRAWIRN